MSTTLKYNLQPNFGSVALKAINGNSYRMNYSVLIKFVHGLAVGFVGNPYIADEVAQSVLYKYLKRKKDPNPITNPKGFIYKCVRNEVFRVKKRMYKEREALSESIARYHEKELDSGLDSLEEAETKAAVLSAVRQLPIELQEVVNLKVFAQMTFKEMSSLLSLPTTTLKSRYQRALGVLKENLNE